MSLRTGLASRAPIGSGIVSLRMVVSGLHLSFPSSFRDIIDVLQPIHASFKLDAGTCSGSCDIVITNDGVVRFTGKVHDSGALAAIYTVIVSLPVASLGPVIIAHRGHVGGALSFDSRTETWDKTDRSSEISSSWAAVKAATPNAKALFGTGTSVTELIEGLIAGATGIFVFKM
jgi:hypothetical protein